MTNIVPEEYDEQVAFVQWLNIKGYPCFHVPNSTYTKSFKQKIKNKKLGVSSGVPDVAVILRGNSGGSPKRTKFLMFIEMKRVSGGSVSESQKQWLSILDDCNNVFAVVAYGAENAIYLVEHYEKMYTKLYSVYCGIVARCTNQNSEFYHRYGGRGIRNNFDGFRDFFDWAMKNNYSPGMTVERIDNDADYSRVTCRFADRKEQANNRSSSCNITAYGRTQTLQQWADEVSIRRETIKRRLNMGWSPERAVTVKPVVGRNQTGNHPL
jgi:hypothetical protein|nr:MAG TPA: Nuclease [Caudoviricetes sp.]